MVDDYIEENKPAEWPCNRHEQAVELVWRATNDFMNNPNYRTREVLVATAARYDFMELSSLGKFRVSSYEIVPINSLWFWGRCYNITSLTMFVYLLVSELCLVDRMIGMMRQGSEPQGMKYPPNDWDSYQDLYAPLLMFYEAYDLYRSKKTDDFGSCIINVVRRVLGDNPSHELLCGIAHKVTILLSDISGMLGSKRDGMLRLSRDELLNLFAFEFELLAKSGQNPAKRPLSSQLMIQISNFVLKSRHGYNEDLICKYMRASDVEKALENGQVWIHDISRLNDDREGAVLENLFADTSWLSYPWVKEIEATDTRKYYVASFSKSMRNEEAIGRYGECVLGYKGDKILDLIAPIVSMTMYRSPDADPSLPETKEHIYLTQVVAFDVLYDEEEIKEELRYLCSIVDLMSITEKEKHDFFESILQYWRYSVKENDPKWVAERERRYVLFTYEDPEYKYQDAVVEDGFLKFNSGLYMYPDFVLGPSSVVDMYRSRIDEKRHSISASKYLFCGNCLNRDFDAPQRNRTRCEICGTESCVIVDPV